MLKIKWKCGGAVVEYKGDLYLVGEYQPEELELVGREQQ